MAETLHRLGATTVTANTNTLLFSTGSGEYAVVAKLMVVNHGSSAYTFRIAHIDASSISSVAAEDYIAYDMPIAANASEPFKRIILEPSQCIMVRASSTNVTFIAWGSKIS